MILNWNKPQKIRTTEEHNNTFCSEADAPGTYVPNMSEVDMKSWKAKHIKNGDDPRVEIRVTVTGKPRGTWATGSHAQVLLVVRPDKTVTFSSNGKAELDPYKLMAALSEAMEVVGV